MPSVLSQIGSLIGQEGAGGGSGDVAGPASSTDNAIARFDGTTGKIIKNSLATINDLGAGVFSDTLSATSITLQGSTDKRARWVRTGANTFSFEQDSSQFYIFNETSSRSMARFLNAGDIQLQGTDADKSLSVIRQTTANIAGRGFTVSAGGATSAATDKAGGGLTLSAGTATGTGASSINFLTATAQGSTSTTDNPPTQKATILGNGNFGIGTAAPLHRLHVQSAAAVSSLTETTATSAFAFNQVAANGGNGYMYSFGSAYATSGKFIAGSTLIDCSGAGGLGLAADLGGIKFYNTTVEAARFLPSGNFGIGETNPLTKLHVSAATAALATVRVQTTADAAPSYELYSGSVNALDRNWRIVNGSTTRGALEIWNSTAVGGTPSVNVLNISRTGDLGVGVTASTAVVHVKAGTATANTAPLKLTAGTSLTIPEDGAIEFDGTHFYGTVGSTRYQLDQQSGGGGGSVFVEVEKNVGAIPRRSGKFTITGLSGLTVGKPVVMSQAAAAYTGKGTLADESEMDGLIVKAVVTAVNTITAYWNSSTFVKGNFKFNYLVGA